MTDHADVPSGRRRPRRQKDQKRIPLSIRVTPQMREGLEWAAERTGRSLTQQTEFLLEQGLERLVNEPGRGALVSEEDRAHAEVIARIEARFDRRVAEFDAPSALSDELINRFKRLEVELAGLRAAVEKGLGRNAEVIARVETRLDRRVAEFETRLAFDAADLMTAVSDLNEMTQGLIKQAFRVLADIQLVLGPSLRSRQAADKPSSRRPAADNGDKDAG